MRKVSFEFRAGVYHHAAQSAARGPRLCIGGLSPSQLLQKTAVLLIAAFQVNSAAIFWSAVFSSSLRAFWATIITLFMMLMGPIFVAEALHGFIPTTVFDIEVGDAFIAFWLLSDSTVSFSSALLLIVPPLFCGSLFLISALLVISRFRWDAPLTGRIRPLQQIAEFVLHFRSSQRGAKGLAVTARIEVPETQPIAWRECRASRALQTSQYLLSAACIPVAFELLRASSLGFSTIDAFFFLQAVFLVAGALIIVGAGSNAFGGERERETLSVLLTIPLSTRDIVMQKLAGVRRRRNLNLIPLGFLAVFSAFLRFTAEATSSSPYFSARFSTPRRIFPGHFFAELYTLTLAWEHLTLVMWVAACWSLASRTTVRAAIGTLSTIVGYCLLHFVMLYLAMETFDGTVTYLLTLLPIVALISVQIDDAPSMVDHEFTQFCLLLSPVFLAAVIALLRFFTLRLAPGWLERDSVDAANRHES